MDDAPAGDAQNGQVTTESPNSDASVAVGTNHTDRGPDVRRVPPGGLRIWAAPDATSGEVGVLEAGHELSIVGRRGRWVHVRDAQALDAWADGSELAGVALGASETDAVPAEPTAPLRPAAPVAVVEKEHHSLLLGTAPVIGVIGALVAGFGAWLPWLQAGADGRQANAFEMSVRTLADWQNAPKPGMSLGWLVVLVAGIGAVLSMIGGGGLFRRVLGFAIVLISAIFVLQFQDLLTAQASGVGTGTNVWDLVDYGVLVTFGGGLVMLIAPSR